MKGFQQVLTTIALVFFSATSFAGYDEFECRSNPRIKMSGLECITCGVQKYYADKGQEEVVPSEKWLALLATNVRAFRELNPSEDKRQTDSIVRSGTALDNFQWLIISQIQAYGFCTKYLGKDTMKTGRSRDYRDMSSQDWDYFRNFISNDEDRSPDALGEAAKKFGFQGSGILGIGGKKEAFTNMRFLMDDSEYKRSTLDDKRKAFREKLADSLEGNKRIASGDDDQGLRECLKEVQQKLRNAPSDMESFNLCGAMAKACDLQRNSNLSHDPCVVSGMGLRPVSTTQPKPLGPPPPPPPPGRSHQGVK